MNFVIRLGRRIPFGRYALEKWISRESAQSVIRPANPRTNEFEMPLNPTPATEIASIHHKINEPFPFRRPLNGRDQVTYF